MQIISSFHLFFLEIQSISVTRLDTYIFDQAHPEMFWSTFNKSIIHWIVLEIGFLKISCNLIGQEHFGQYTRNQFHDLHDHTFYSFSLDWQVLLVYPLLQKTIRPPPHWLRPLRNDSSSLASEMTRTSIFLNLINKKVKFISQDINIQMSNNSSV